MPQMAVFTGDAGGVT